MDLKRTKLNIGQSAKSLSKNAKTGVSLHCHTELSKEMLDFVPHYAEKLPIIARFWRREKRLYFEREGIYPDFSEAFWSPPLSPNAVYEIEKQQINDAGLDAIVSLTDHDSIDATLIVNEQAENARAPISMEWTVPFDFGFFHVGVHNLPKESAAEITQTLLDYTFVEDNHTEEKLTETFAMLNELPGVLIILNHPIWDIELVGKERHKVLLKDFLRVHGRWIHALEVNGFRSWSENKAVIELAEAMDMSLATGGDRHGCKPNTVINVTNAGSFEEFVHEIRVDKRSEIVLLPEYEHPLHSRQLNSFAEILKYYNEFPEGRKKWFDRVHYDIRDGHGVRPLSEHWDRGGPAWLRVAVWTLGILGSPAARPLFRLAREKKDRIPKNLTISDFELPQIDEVLPPLSTETPVEAR